MAKKARNSKRPQQKETEGFCKSSLEGLTSQDGDVGRTASSSKRPARDQHRLRSWGQSLKKSPKGEGV